LPNTAPCTTRGYILLPGHHLEIRVSLRMNFEFPLARILIFQTILTSIYVTA
jgi:hypothetical protein